MGIEFDKKIVFDNITFLLKQYGKKVGELEAEAGVSIGYISRSSKDENTKPGIDFIMKVAETLNISIDTLLKVNLSEHTATEKYLISFMEKLISDTNDDKLDWKRESAESLNRLEADYMGYVEHPLFSLETFYEQIEDEYCKEITRVVFTSNAFDCHTYINGDCYNLRLKNGAILYLMNISKSVHRVNDKNAYVKEVWMRDQYGDTQYLCGNKPESPIATLVEQLYLCVSNNAKHPKIKQNFRYAIDAYMKDDLKDDFEPQLPFV